MDKKTSVYVCTGCGIGGCLDAQRLAEVAQGEFQLPAQAYPNLCLPEGVEFLRRHRETTGAERVVLAACSPRVNWDVFSPDSLGAQHVERVNIREQVTWSHPPLAEETQKLAADYLRVGIVRAQKVRPPAPSGRDVEQTVLVVGGGITGLTAALAAAATGYDVALVEKNARLGGWVGQFYKLFPTQAPFHQLQALDVEARIAAILANPRIKAFTSSTLEQLSGQPGDFRATILRPEGPSTLRFGAAILATGWQPHLPPDLDYLGYGRLANVVSSLQLEEMAKAGPILRPSDGRTAKAVAFVQRLRPKDPQHFSYGAGVADMVALKQALYVKERNPDAKAYILYEHMVTPGLYEAFYRRVREEGNVFFSRAEVIGVAPDGEGGLLLDAENALLGGRVRLQADLVVLPTGMAPATAQEPGLELLYRQGKGLPSGKHGFSDSNFICFPYETRRTGLYAAGGVREPLDVPASCEDATGAALKAIQSVAMAQQGASVHPRSGDLSLPVTSLQGCTQCGRCSEECPFSAIELDAKGYPTLQSARCRRCGICMGACPTRVISFEDYSVEILSSTVKALVPPDDPEAPWLLAFACENDAYPAFDLAGIGRLTYDSSLRVIPVRCLGSLNVAVVSDALSRGLDGILLLGCKSGDGYQCHFITGSGLAERRMANLQETLQRQMLEPGRVKMVELEISEGHLIPGLVKAFVEEIHRMGPNPFKGL